MLEFDGLTRETFCPSSRNLKSKIKVLIGLVSSTSCKGRIHARPLTLWFDHGHFHVHMYVCVCINSPFLSGPSSYWSRFSSNNCLLTWHQCEDSISKLSHIWRYWGLQCQHIHFYKAHTHNTWFMPKWLLPSCSRKTGMFWNTCPKGILWWTSSIFI